MLMHQEFIDFCLHPSVLSFHQRWTCSVTSCWGLLLSSLRTGFKRFLTFYWSSAQDGKFLVSIVEVPYVKVFVIYSVGNYFLILEIHTCSFLHMGLMLNEYYHYILILRDCDKVQDKNFRNIFFSNFSKVQGFCKRQMAGHFHDYINFLQDILLYQ